MHKIIGLKTQTQPRLKNKIKDYAINTTSKSNSKNQIKSLNLSSFTIYQLMIKDPFSVNTLLKNEETFLSTSLKNNDKLTSELILTSPILDLSFKDKNGNSYLHLAIRQKFENIIRILVEKKIELNTINNKGMTPLDYARFFKLNQNIINFLIIKGAKGSEKNNNKIRSATPLYKNCIPFTHGNSIINLNLIKCKKDISKGLNNKTQLNNDINNDNFNKYVNISCNELISNTITTTPNYSRNTLSNLILKKKKLQRNTTSEINPFGYKMRKSTPKKNIKYHFWSPVSKSPRISFFQNSNKSFFTTTNNNLKKPNNIKKRLFNKAVNYNTKNMRKVFLRNENNKKINNTAFIKNNDIKLKIKHMVSSKTNKNLNHSNYYPGKNLTINKKKKPDRNLSSLWLIHQKINKINNNYDYSKTYFTTKIINNQNINQANEQNITKENIQNISTTNNKNMYTVSPCYGEQLYNTFSEKTNNFDEIPPHITIININASNLNNLNNTTSNNNSNNNNVSNINTRYINNTVNNHINHNYSNINSLNNNTNNSNNFSYNEIKNNYTKYNNLSYSISNATKKNNKSAFLYDEIKNQSLYQFLSEIGMEKYCNVMILNGYDDIKLLIQQTKKGLYIEEKELKEVGILIPGDRAKILIYFLEKGEALNFKVPKNIYHICKYQNINTLINNDGNVKKLYEWLKKISMEKYLINFINAGYFSVELLFVQMATKNPLTLEFLKSEIKIGVLRDRIKILNKLIEDVKIFIENENNEVIKDKKNDNGCLII